MKKFLKRFNNKFFLGLFISYIIVFSIPVISNLRMNNTLVQQLQNFTKTHNNRELLSIVNTIDSYILDVEELAIQLSRDSSYKKVSLAPTQLTNDKLVVYKELENTWSIYTENKKVVNQNKSFLYLENQERIFSSHGLYEPYLYYSQRVDPKDKGIEYEKWRDFLDNTSEFSLLINNYQQLGIPYNNSLILLCQIPSSPQVTTRGKLVVEIDKQVLVQLFRDLPHTDYAYIEDSAGNRFVTVGNEEEIEKYQELILPVGETEGSFARKNDNETVIINFVVSPLKGWKYVTVVSENIFYSEVKVIQNTNKIFLSVILLVGLAVAVLLSIRAIRPIMTIADRFNKYTDGIEGKKQLSDPFSAMYQGLDSLIDYKNQLQEGLERQKPYMQKSFLRDLSLGDYHSREELLATLEYLELPNLQGNLYVALVRIRNRELELVDEVDAKQIEINSLCKTIVGDVFTKRFGEEILVHDADAHQIAILFSDVNRGLSPTYFLELLMEHIGEIQEFIDNEYHLDIFAGVSSICHNPEEIWRAYQQAKLALEFAVGKNIISNYDNLSLIPDEYYYPFAIDTRLYNLSKACDKEGINGIMDILYEENFVLRKLSRDNFNELLIELKVVLTKSSNHLADKELINRIKSSGKQSAAVEAFETIRQLFLEICSANQARQEENQDSIVQEAKKYIEVNYQDSSLSLHKLATISKLSDGYLSYIFKEESGVNFVDYLEQIRLEHSKKLLEETNKTIVGIAETVGYNSAQSYRRAFKKIFKITPNEYRETYKKEE